MLACGFLSFKIRVCKNHKYEVQNSYPNMDGKSKDLKES